MSVRYLNEAQKNRIKQVVAQRKNCIFFRAKDYDPERRAVDTATNAVEVDNAVGDVGHFLAHGLTFGSMFHMAFRGSSQESNWQEHVRRTCNRAWDNGLSVYQWSGKGVEQVVIVGRNYLSIHQKGEYSKRDVYFKKIKQISYEAGKGIFLVADKGGKLYSYYQIHEVYRDMPLMIVHLIQNTLQAL